MIVVGGSKGIGKNIADNLKRLKIQTIACSRKEIDTSNLQSIKNFAVKLRKQIY